MSNSVMMTNVNRTLSKKLSNRVRAKDKDCYRNSIAALVASDDKAASYVEGYAIGEGLPLVQPHGWMEVRGRVVEVTPVWLKMTTARYFPVTRLSLEEVSVQVSKHNKSLPWFLGDVIPEEAKSAWTEAQKEAWGNKYAEIAAMFGWEK